MEQQLALSVLVQAAQVAQSKGAFSLKEAGIVAQAVAAFAPPEVVQEEVSEEAEEEVSEDETSS
tara:strand:+ start:151 stop:342 length:192 start_codon:yes stop_codon:yes gene_type:complete